MHARPRLLMVTKQNLKQLFNRTLPNSIPRSALTQIFFVGLIVASFLATANRRIDVKLIDLAIACVFLCIFLLGCFLIAEEFLNVTGSFLSRFTLRVGLSTSLLFALGLGLIRLNSKYRDVTWNVDSRLFLSQAYSFISHGNSNSSNSYFGFDIQYHATPSYISAQIYKFFGIDPSIILFLAVPMVTVTAIYFFTKSIFKERGFSQVNSGIGALIVMSISYVTSVSQRDKLLAPLINNEVMLNAQLAIAVVVATTNLHLKSVTGKHSLTILGIVSLWNLKPQYIPFAIVFLLVLTIIRLPDRDLKIVLRTIFPIILTSALAISLIYPLSKSELNPEYSISFVNLSVSDFLKSNMMLASIIPIHLVMIAFQKTQISYRKLLDVYLVIGVFLLCRLMLDVISFEPSFAVLRKMQVLQETKPSGDSDFNQGLILLFILIAVSAVIAFSEIELRLANLQKAVCLLLISLSLFRISFAAPTIARPSINGYEATDLASLRQVLTQAERRIFKPRILVNDFSDPAEDYRRNGSGMYWSSLGIGEFYLSDINTFHFLAPDIKSRLKNTKKFFSTPISDFQINFINSNKIDFIVINKRCTPNWYPDVDKIVSTSGFALIDAKAIKVQKFHNKSIFSNQSLLFGKAPCI